MSNWKTILGILVALGVLSVVLMAGPPDKTQQCIVTGEIVSVPDGVEIGTSVGAWVLFDGDTPGVLWLEGNLLTNANNNPDLVAGYFYGQARMLKSNGPEGARFDFEFDTAECTSPPSDCGPPPWGDNDNCCRYRLVLRDGTYDKKNDLVEYNLTARIDLADYTLGPPCAEQPNNLNCVDDYLVGSGQVLTNILFQFLPEGDDGGDDPVPEKGDLCDDGKDNDMDGYTDCDDRGCKKAEACR